MCLARVYVKKEGEPPSRDAVLSDVAWVEVQPGRLVLQDLLGKEKVVQGTISSIDFVYGVVTLTRTDE